MTLDERTARIAELERKLKARRGKAGFERNIREIEAELLRLREEG